MGKWPMVKLGEALRKSDTWIALRPEETYKQITVKLWGKGVVLRGIVAGAEIAASQQLQVKADQFILSRIDARNGAFGLVPSELDGGVVSNDFPVFDVVLTKMLPGYMGWLCKTRDFVDQCRQASEGTTNRVRLKEDRFLEIPIPLPPLAEQRRIVARIDALAAKIDETRGLRKQAGDEAEAVRTSGINEVFSTLGKTVRPMPLEALSDCRLGKMLSQNLTEGSDGTPYLRNANVQWDYLDLSSIYRMKIGLNELQTYLLHPGDILVCEGGDIGKSAIFNGEIEGCIFQKALHRVRVFKEKAIPRFILYHIFWGAAQGHFSEIKTQTTIAHLTGVKLKKYGILCPPIPEQRRIVTRLDALQAQVDVLKQAQAASTAELDALLPSVLDRAFNGEAL